MRRSRNYRTFAARVAAVGACGAGAVAGPAQAEVVSKLPGTGGLPFPARFSDASTDGRFVLVRVVVPALPAASGPEADLAALGSYVLRDREADTTTPLTFRVAPGEPPLSASPVQVSDDGDRILIQGSDPALKAFTGVGVGDALGAPTAVYDRSEGRLLRLPTSPTPPTYGASTVLSADGKQVVFRGFPEVAAVDNPRYPIYRGPLEGTATTIVNLPNVSEVHASADLRTVLYTRYLAAVTRPVEDYPRTGWFQGQILGAVVGAGEPRVIAEATRTESPTPGATSCAVDAGITSRQINIALPNVAPDGSRVAWLSTDAAHTLVARAADGTKSTIPTPTAGGFPWITAFGNANQVFFSTPAGTGPVEVDQELVHGDTELIGSATAFDVSTGATDFATRYVEAQPYTGAPVTKPAPTMTFTDEPVDTAARTSSATWYSCPPGGPTSPVGTFEQYFDNLFLARPYSAKYNIGSAIMRSVPSSAVRPASRLTAEVTLFGLPYWKKTVTGSSAYASFPKPLAWLPMTLKLTAQFAATPGQAAPAPIVRSYSVYTTRTN